MRPWSPIPIHDCGEPLLPLPLDLLRLEPHPYVAAGAPYGADACPFRLRQGVIERLLQVQRLLQERSHGCRLAIFDAWRPLAVQRFMLAYATAEECQRRGVDPFQPSAELEAVEKEVGRFWAPPSDDPATPPPHSTGAAVDLTLAGPNGEPLDLGSPIDAIGAVSEPDYFAGVAREASDPELRNQAALFNQRRDLLAAVMLEAGFAQHPNEWWHFSHGDQLWAWRKGEHQAIYGRWGGLSSPS
ncbi:MAG: M15 family metallopeptidase [Vulcanococcus sp.]|jgi:D-alanyl-D-alanine dipeptidase|uniref:M15 family metallopeptidase n=1 Tax=Vulcanococcus sp. TaxID=2856995 RepID=UPI0025FE5A90|nr:M15 family metallopeptidase [Vulcanococcus sp.]MBW0175042.1 M15 family metallopeptidase [Vulcanococcus sp.]MBW0182139.1 M15 family metallopeptidase [Vulcanococcus sp.]